MDTDGLEERVQESETQEAEVDDNPYDLLVEELVSITDVYEKWTILCTFALASLQQAYGLWLSTVIAGETLNEKVIIGIPFLESVMIQKQAMDDAVRRQAMAQAEQQQGSGITVPVGTILRQNRPLAKRGRRRRKQ